jgi:hypothetical protein
MRKNQLINAISTLDCMEVEVESDAYIPLTVTWDVGGIQQPLYWRISGNSGGELEIKVDPECGVLRELIVIDEPPPWAEKAPPESLPEPETGIPVFDLSPWEISINPDYSEFTSRIITSTENVTMARENGMECLLFSAKPTSRILACGDTQIHLADDGTLRAVAVRVPTG